MKKLLPFALRALAHRIKRQVEDCFPAKKFAAKKCFDAAEFPILLVEHKSKLIRNSEMSDLTLQQNKVTNLRIATVAFDCLTIQSGELFSFFKTLGAPCPAKGYLLGYEIHDGKPTASIGGGLCQVANMLYWLAMRLNFEIVERHHHSVDLFPDDDRCVPFGLGATVFYNYLDLRFRNTHSKSVLIRLCVDPPFFKGAIYGMDGSLKARKIYATNERFIRDKRGEIWRENTILASDDNGNGFGEANKLMQNRGRVMYELRPDQNIEEETS